MSHSSARIPPASHIGFTAASASSVEYLSVPPGASAQQTARYPSSQNQMTAQAASRLHCASQFRPDWRSPQQWTDRALRARSDNMRYRPASWLRPDRRRRLDIRRLLELRELPNAALLGLLARHGSRPSSLAIARLLTARSTTAPLVIRLSSYPSAQSEPAATQRRAGRGREISKGGCTESRRRRSQT